MIMAEWGFWDWTLLAFICTLGGAALIEDWLGRRK